MHCPGLGWGGDRDARVPPCWPGSLTALCSRPRRGLALGCRWAGPRGGCGGSATGSCRRCYCWVSSRPTTEKALRPSPRVEDSRVAKGGVRRDAGALSPDACPTEVGGAGGGTWTLCALQKLGGYGGGGRGVEPVCPLFCPAKAVDTDPLCHYVPCLGEGGLYEPRIRMWKESGHDILWRFSRDDPRFYSRTSLTPGVEASPTPFLPETVTLFA